LHFWLDEFFLFIVFENCLILMSTYEERKKKFSLLQFFFCSLNRTDRERKRKREFNITLPVFSFSFSYVYMYVYESSS
jgi:hypothetical protein